MRSRASAQGGSLGEGWNGHSWITGSAAFCAPFGADAEQVADGEHEIGAVHGVEMEGVDAVLCQFLHLAGGDRRGHELAGLGIVVEALELRSEPVRHGGAGAGHEVAGLLEIVHGHDAGHDRNA